MENKENRDENKRICEYDIDRCMKIYIVFQIYYMYFIILYQRKELIVIVLERIGVLFVLLYFVFMILRDKCYYFNFICEIIEIWRRK